MGWKGDPWNIGVVYTSDIGTDGGGRGVEITVSQNSIMPIILKPYY